MPSARAGWFAATKSGLAYPGLHCIARALSRHIVGGRAKAKQAASTSQMGRFETDVLTQAKNLSALMDLSGRWIDTVHRRKPIREIILDLSALGLSLAV